MKISWRQGQFEPVRVDNSARTGGIIRISLIFYNMKVYCMFTLESPHRGDSNEYTQYTIFQYEKSTLNYPKSAAMGIFSKGLKNEFERAVVNEPSVFEPLKFYCNQLMQLCTARTVLSILVTVWLYTVKPEVCSWLTNEKQRQTDIHITDQ